MDLEMPVLDGHGATRRIRDWESTHHRTRLPIIALTANAFAEDRERSLRSGMDDFLAKPIIAEDLMAVLGKWLKPGRPSSTHSSATASASATSAGRALNVPRFLDLSETLIMMLKQGKFDAVHRFSELEDLLQGTSQAEALIEVHQAVQAFQFEKAVAALSRIRDQL
jgi:CheY-like chemotaxis protein